MAAWRVQDVTARVAGINLKSTVRVLRALDMVAEATGNHQLRDSLNQLLVDSTNNGGDVLPLDSKPSVGATKECGELFDNIVKQYGWKNLRKLQDLSDCPYRDAVEKE